MAESGKAEETESRGISVTWPAEDYAKLEEAARALSAREHFKVTTTDIIRSGALRRAEEILGAE